jgi:hypothetical protein
VSGLNIMSQSFMPLMHSKPDSSTKGRENSGYCSECAQLFEDMREVKSQVSEHYRELPAELTHTEISVRTEIHRSWSRKVFQYLCTCRWPEK